jgi:hypothetical protein
MRGLSEGVMPTTELDKKLTRYLLGDLPEQERIDIEDRYLSDGVSFDALAVAEDELIDDSVRGRLSRKDRDLFEQNFLTSAARLERVKSSRALMEFVDSQVGTSRVSWWQRVRSAFKLGSPAMGLVLATGFMMLIVGGPLLIIQMSRLRSDLKGLQSEQLARDQRESELQQSLAQQKRQNDELNQAINSERAERGQLEQEVERLKEQRAPTVAFTLGFGEIERSKGGPPEATKLTLPHGAEAIKLRLDLLKDEYENYLVVLENAQQHEIWRGLLQSTSAGRGRAVVVRLPSRLFDAGLYKLTLSGTNNKRDYEVMSEFNVDVIRK